MSRTERLFRLTSLLRNTKSLRFDEALQRLAISPATLKRDLKYLRGELGIPIEYDAFERVYKVDSAGHQQRKELPGLWFNEAELNALAFAQHLLDELVPHQGLAPNLRAVIQRVGGLTVPLGASYEWLERVRVVMPRKRAVDGEAFEVVCTALLQRRQVQIRHITSPRQVSAKLRVSPQRMVFCDTWYLDALCHPANELKRFAMDAVGSAEALNKTAEEVSLKQVEQLFDYTYGTVPGQPNRWATLVFTADVAEVVDRETWHPMQRKRHLENSQLELLIPYNNANELVVDALRYGEQVVVKGDDVMVNAMRSRVRAVFERYQS